MPFKKIDKEEAITLRKQGMKLREIAELYGVSYQAIYFHIKNPEPVKKTSKKYQASTKYKKVKRYADYLAIENKKHPPSQT